MGFQIKDKDGKAITISELDSEAAIFWGVEIHPKHYAMPQNGAKVNWFDTIGYHIHSNDSSWHKHYSKTTWMMVKESLMICITDVLNITPEELIMNRDYWKSTFDLIDHWESKGYTPHKVED